jgi:hypothetical protein
MEPRDFPLDRFVLASGAPAEPPQVPAVQFAPGVFNLLMQMLSAAVPEIRYSDGINRRTWLQAEDDLLMKAVGQIGSKKWADVAKLVPYRTSKQCRERWCNTLAPNVKHEPFEPWEDAIIVQKQRELGNRWSAITRELPGRSPNSVKNRWYSSLKYIHEPRLADFTHQLDPELMPGSGFIRTEYRDDGHLGNGL